MSDLAIDLRGVSFGYGRTHLFKDLSLGLQSGSTYSLVGASGSGKTSLLQIMNGLLRPQAGQVLIDGQAIDHQQSFQVRRKMGYVLQGSGLFPHLTVLANMGLVAGRKGWTEKQIQERALQLCELLSLPASSEFLRRRPGQLSGGQQQRVGLARALFLSPKIILMDEPLSALDPITRKEIQSEIIRIQKILSLTLVIVTHDLAEAFLLSHEILLLHEGAVLQRGRPNQLLLHPANDYVADFVRSHSPGQRLKEIPLYSIMNTRIWVTFDEFRLRNLETGEAHSFVNRQELKSFVIAQGQTALYWVDERGVFLKAQEINSGAPLPSSTGRATDHLLDGLQRMFQDGLSRLPILNQKGELVGVLSEGALRAL